MQKSHFFPYQKIPGIKLYSSIPGILFYDSIP